MSIYDQSEQRPLRWPFYLATGCGICIFLVVIGVFALRWWVQKQLAYMMNPPPIKSSGHYTFGYSASAANVSVKLPDKKGQVTYIHYLISPKNDQAGEGERCLRVVSSGKTREWPLPYSHMRDVRVGVYWHSAKAGNGPYLRVSDVIGQSVLDLGRGEVGMYSRIRGHAFIADYLYNEGQFQGPSMWSDSTGVTSIESANGKPAIDVTSAFKPDNCRYLGSIIQIGNNLKFVPAKNLGHVLSKLHHAKSTH